jgi:hypothetical protein
VHQIKKGISNYITPFSDSVLNQSGKQRLLKQVARKIERKKHLKCTKFRDQRDREIEINLRFSLNKIFLMFKKKKKHYKI